MSAPVNTSQGAGMHPLANTMNYVQAKVMTWYNYTVQATLNDGTNSANYQLWGASAEVSDRSASESSEKMTVELQSLAGKIASVAFYTLAAYVTIKASLYIGASVAVPSLFVGATAIVLATAVGLVDPVSPIELMTAEGRQKLSVQYDSLVELVSRYLSLSR